MPDGSVIETQWLVSKAKFEQLLKEKRIEFRRKRDGTYQVYRKYYEKDGGGTIKPPSLIDKYPNTEAKFELKILFNVQEGRDNVFYTVKPTNLIKHLFEPFLKNDEAIILDFFAGTCTTAHAVMKLNAEDGGNRKFIMIQLPEPCYENSKAFEAGYKTIAEIGKERIRRAAAKIREEHPDWNGDTGFRVLKVDSSNLKDVYYRPDQLEQPKLRGLTDHIKEDRTSEDLLFQVLLDWGVDLSLPITREIIAGREVFFVDENALAACFEKTDSTKPGITEDFVKELAKREPLRVVFLDQGFRDDSVKINVEQIFKVLLPHTEVKTI